MYLIPIHGTKSHYFPVAWLSVTLNRKFNEQVKQVSFCRKEFDRISAAANKLFCNWSYCRRHSWPLDCAKELCLQSNFVGVGSLPICLSFSKYLLWHHIVPNVYSCIHPSVLVTFTGHSCIDEHTVSGHQKGSFKWDLQSHLKLSGIIIVSVCARGDLKQRPEPEVNEAIL